MSFSQFGDKFTQPTGISRLMEDMGEGLRTPGTIMLGGGNPAERAAWLACHGAKYCADQRQPERVFLPV